MNEDSLRREYEEIVRRYNIKAGTTLGDIRKFLRQEMKKYHSDNNSDKNAVEIAKAISGYLSAIKQLIRKYGENYVYVVDKGRTSNNNGNGYSNNNTGGHKTNPNNGNGYSNNNTGGNRANPNNGNGYSNNNTGGNRANPNNGNGHSNGNTGGHKTNPNNGNGHSNGNTGGNGTNNGNDYDPLKEEIKKFKKWVKKIKKKYSFIPNIVGFAKYILDDKLPYVNSFQELGDLISFFDLNIEYYRLQFLLISNKKMYENDEIDNISDEIMYRLMNINPLTVDIILNLEREYYNRIDPIVTEIEEEIDRKISPIIKILDLIKDCKNVNIDFFLLYDCTNDLWDLKSVKRVDGVIKDWYFKIKKAFIKQLKKDMKIQDLSSYASQILLKVDSTNNFYDLGEVIKEYNNTIMNFVNKAIKALISDLEAFIVDNDLKLFDKSDIEDYIHELKKVDSKKGFDYFVKEIEKEKLDILIEKFRKRIYDDDVLDNYAIKLYDIKSIKELNNLILQYEEEKKRLTEEKEAFSLLKEEMASLINSIKEETDDVGLYMKLNTYLLRLGFCDSFDEVKKLYNEFKEYLSENNILYGEQMSSSDSRSK